MDGNFQSNNVEPVKGDAQLLEMLQGTPIPTFIIDAGHVITHWNAACEHTIGFAAKDMIGTRRQWEPFYPTIRPVMADLILDNASEEEISRYYGDHWRCSPLITGAYEAEDYYPEMGPLGTWLYFTAAPLRDVEGRVVGAIETLQDISERKRAEEALRESEHRYYELSITDGLTGLYNSRHFYCQIKVEMERAQRYQHPLSLMMLDVDNFKQYNDTYGHLEGDLVLSGLAQEIFRCIRQADSAYRYGGEEFMVLLPETGCKEALRVAERLRSSFAQRFYIPASGNVNVGTTISIGISCYQQGDSAKEFIRRADSGTYAAKRLGKNRVVFNAD